MGCLGRATTGTLTPCIRGGEGVVHGSFATVATGAGAPEYRRGTTMSARWKIGLAGAVVGAGPGLILLATNIALVEGEAQLTLGVTSMFLVLLGAAAGATYAAGRAGKIPAVPMVGAMLGVLPGLFLYRLLPGHPVALVLVLAGAVAGGLLGSRLALRRPPQAH